jgi:hypothetical protein
MSAILGTYMYLLSMLVCLLLCIWGIVALVRSIPCTNCAPNIYERFEDTSVSDLAQRSTTIEKLTDAVEAALDAINTTQTETCSIRKQIEDGYIADRSSPPDELEYSFSPEEQQRRTDARKIQAKARFQTEQEQYVSLHGDKPILECFASKSLSDAELDLNEKIATLESMMNSKAVTKAQATMDRIQSTLGFHAKYLSKLLASLAPKKEEKEKKEKKEKKEGFASLLHGKELLANADTVIAKAQNFLAHVQRIVEATKQHTDATKALNQKSADVQSGKTL